MTVSIKTPKRARLFSRLKSTVPGIEKELDIANERSAKQMAALAEKYAPQDTRELIGSIKAEKAREGSFGGLALGSSWSVTAGADSVDGRKTGGEGFYARWVEFGTSLGQRAQPFFFPAYRLIRRSHRSRISRGIRKAVKRAAL